MPKALRITVLFRGEPMRVHSFGRDRIVIGRDAECDVRLENVGVSRHHALVERREEAFVLRDLGSSNGTQVAGQSISSWIIPDRGKARITKFDLVFDFVDAESVSEPGGTENGDQQTTEGAPGFGEQNTMCVAEAKRPRAGPAA